MKPKERGALVAQICRALKKNKTFFLSGHEKPDGDTVASEIAMASLLRRLKKSVDVYNAEPVPQSLRFLAGAEDIKTSKKVEKNYDVAIVFECFDQARMGNVLELKKRAKCVINIDHHRHHSMFGDINMVNVQASSNSEQLYYVFEKLKMPITKNEAAALYVGMITDTGRFRHSNTNAETLRIAAHLIERGADPALLSEKIYGTSSYSAIKLLGHSLSEMKLTEDGKIAYGRLTRADFERLHSNEEETEEIVNYGLQIPTVLISILVRQSNGNVKVSLRSRRNVDVCQLAQKFGGGGHKYAAGCKMPGTVDSVIEQLLVSARALV